MFTKKKQKIMYTNEKKCKDTKMEIVDLSCEDTGRKLLQVNCRTHSQ